MSTPERYFTTSGLKRAWFFVLWWSWVLWNTTRSHIEQFLSIPRKKFSQWQWFLECSPGAFPTKKVLGHLCISKWQWFLECSSRAFPTRMVLDQLWLQKRLVFHFIVAWVLWAWHRWPLPEATLNSFINSKAEVSKWHWFLECSPDSFPT